MIDLHTHTTYSDGSQTPTELVEEAAAIGLTAIAVTDHDTVDGLPEALAAGERLGVDVIPGVEINLEHDRVTMDMLGYFLAGMPTDELKRELADLRAYRDERNARMVERLAELGMPLDPLALAAAGENGAVGRPHIGEAMVRHGYVSSINEAFDLYLRRGAPAWVDRRRLALGRALGLLRASGALPVLAHPGIIRTDDAGLNRIVRDAARAGMVGIECYYPLHDRETVRRCLGLAERYALVPTGGSDYHGTVKPKARLGVGSLGGPVPDHALVDLRCLAEDQLERLA
ncbi:MAG: PHP domain-containing protein [Actinobacteria bacterium]|nr:PHP domain-containing protein [Actinomycetota bacterium]